MILGKNLLYNTVYVIFYLILGFSWETKHAFKKTENSNFNFFQNFHILLTIQCKHEVSVMSIFIYTLFIIPIVHTGHLGIDKWRNK